MIQFQRPETGRLLISFRGEWRTGAGHPPVAEVYRQMEPPPATTHVAFDCTELTGWNSVLINFLVNIIDYGRRQGIFIDQEGLPPGITGMLKLAYAVPERPGARQYQARPPLLERLGKKAWDWWQSSAEVFAFIGEATAACGRMLRGRARFRCRDLMVIIQECGVQALPSSASW